MIDLRESERGKITGRFRKSVGLFGIFLGSFCLAFTCGQLSFVTLDTSANSSAGSQLSVTLQPTLAISTNPAVLSLDLEPTPTGKLATGEIQINIGSNNLTGYKAHMEVSGPDTSLTHADSTSTIANTENTTAGILLPNTWGYNIGTNESNSNTFKAFPEVESNASIDQVAAPVENRVTVVGVGANANTALPSGSYMNTLMFSVIANEVPRPEVVDIDPVTAYAGRTVTITGSDFHAGGASSVVSAVRVGATDCVSFEVISDTVLTCAVPTIPTSGEYPVTVITPMGLSNINVTLDIVIPEPIQDFTVAKCTAMQENETVFTVDARNNEFYRVKKMPDQKCWMIDNLKYIPTGSTPTYTQTTSGYMTADGTTTQSTSNTDVARWGDPSGTSYCQGTTNMPSETTTKCGYLYNWYGATYGTGLYNTSTQGTSVTGSICPNNSNPGNTNDAQAGPWHLPTGNTGTTNSTTLGDFGVLDQALGGSGQAANTAAAAAPWLFSGSFQGTYSGNWYTSLNGQGSYGRYWSSTAYSSTGAYVLSFDSSSINPGTYSNYKFNGYAVRCVLSP